MELVRKGSGTRPACWKWADRISLLSLEKILADGDRVIRNLAICPVLMYAGYSVPWS